MELVRNVSGQSLVLRKPGGGVIHLFPGRAVSLPSEELRSSQLQQLLRAGFVQRQTLTGPQPVAPRSAKKKKRPEKKDSREAKHRQHTVLRDA